MKTVTIDDVMDYGPCWDDARQRMEKIAERYNQQDWTALDVLMLPEKLVSNVDKFWLVLREELIDAPILHEFACQCAEHALSRIDNPDPRSVAAIVAKRAWLKGEITDDELKTAYDAARSAACTADAAYAAVRATTAHTAYWAANASYWAADADSYWAAYDAARTACWAAHWSASSAAYWAAFWDAFWDATYAADRAAARAAAERAWQVDTLIKMLKDIKMKNSKKSPLIWVGGKSKLSKILLPMFPEHKGYVEVFGGAGHMLFAKKPSRWEVLNDFDGELMNFWSVVKNEPQKFIDSFKYTLVSRETFDTYKQIYKDKTEDDCIKKAHIFYYLVKAGFAADMKNPYFGTRADSRNRLRLEQIPSDIKEAHERLIKVTIENKTFEDIFSIYDSKDTFFYLDSPYRNAKRYETGVFTDEQYKTLADYCKNIKGKWLYTINDDEYIRELFKDFNIMTHDVFYSVCKEQNGRRGFNELIITNYEIVQNKEVNQTFFLD